MGSTRKYIYRRLGVSGGIELMTKVIKNTKQIVFEGTTKECVNYICNNQESALNLVLVHDDRREKNDLQLRHERKIFNE